MSELPENSPESVKDPGSAKVKGRSFIYHLHPPKVAKASIRFDRTFGLGGMALLLFLIQAFSGLLLRFVYIPTPADAYDSILSIDQNLLFGKLVRNIHHWSGILMVIVTFLHFIRTFLSQAYYDVRRVNWLLGLGLLILVVFSNFTGYLLPWDQLAFWAVTVATNMLEYLPLLGNSIQLALRGGTEVGSATLLNFYNLHTGVLPLVMTIIMIYHFWKVRKAKGVAIPEVTGRIERVPANPDLIIRELVIGLVLIALVMILSVLFSAPLLERANPSFSPNPAKAPWYFMGVQEMLLHIHPFFSAVVIPVLYFGALIYLPYVEWKDRKPGVWFHSERGKKFAKEAALLSVVLTPLAVIADEYLFRFKDWVSGVPQLVSQGVIPFLLVIVTLVIYYLYLKKKRKANNIEIVIAFFVVFIVSYMMLTIIGIWFRGEGMTLVYPWNI